MSDYTEWFNWKWQVKNIFKNRVRPYYIYQCELSIGLSHFRTPVNKGIEIMEGLRGHTSGFAFPTYVIDDPGGGGKIPLMPNYKISCSAKKVILRNFEGIITTYQESDSYEHKNCDNDCDSCSLCLDMEEPEKNDFVGIKKLLDDNDPTISLIPDDIERIKNRDDY